MSDKEEFYFLTPEEEIEETKRTHERWPAKGAARCPECNLFSAYPWEQEFGTQNGTQYVWGGVCKTHGAWREGS